LGDLSPLIKNSILKIFVDRKSKGRREDMAKNAVTRKLARVFPVLTEGKFFSRIRPFFKYVVVPAPDKFLGAVSRYLLSIFTPVQKDKVLFTTFQGDYTCNPKYITEELLRTRNDVKIVWAVRKTALLQPELFPPEVKLVERATYDFYREWASAKVLVVNSVDVFIRYMPKKRSQFLLQTWHGSLGIKRFGKDNQWTLLSAAEKMAKKTDAIISNSVFENNVYKDTFWDKVPIWEYGHPRNDILISVQNNPELAEKLQNNVRQFFQLDSDTKIALYAPTFRNMLNVKVYNLEAEGVLNALQGRFGGNWVLLVRLHPTARKKAKKVNLISKHIDGVLNATPYPDMQELIIVSDFLITDYSSCIYDYVLSKRPGMIFATDIRRYNNERGFYYPLESTPFPIATNNEELIREIEGFDLASYEKKVETFLKEKGCFEDGCASKRTVATIEKILGEIN